MLRRVKRGDPQSTDDLSPLVMREFKPVFTIDIFPYLIFRRLGIEDQPIEVKNKSLDPRGCPACVQHCFPKSIGTIVTCHSRQIIPEQRACYTFYTPRAERRVETRSVETRRRSACLKPILSFGLHALRSRSTQRGKKERLWTTSIILTTSSSITS